MTRVLVFTSLVIGDFPCRVCDRRVGLVPANPSPFRATVGPALALHVNLASHPALVQPLSIGTAVNF